MIPIRLLDMLDTRIQVQLLRGRTNVSTLRNSKQGSSIRPSAFVRLPVNKLTPARPSEPALQKFEDLHTRSLSPLLPRFLRSLEMQGVSDPVG